MYAIRSYYDTVALDNHINEDLAELFGDVNEPIVQVSSNSTLAPLSEVLKLAEKLK